MKTPDEIKRGLEYCIEQKECRACPYRVRGPIIDCLETMHKEVLAYIRELEARVAELERVKKERDAAVADINMCCPCEVCTRSCTYDKVNPYDECADFEWRGVKNDA